MSRSRFMPLAPGAPARWLAGSVALPAVALPGVARRLLARPDARTDRRARATVNARTSVVPCLGMSVSLAAGQTDRLADIILDRVLSCPYPVGTVILDLHAASDIDADSRSALLSLHRRLRSLGTQLRIATASHQLASRLREAGLPPPPRSSSVPARSTTASAPPSSPPMRRCPVLGSSPRGSGPRWTLRSSPC
jgi:hypothetical protein